MLPVHGPYCYLFMAPSVTSAWSPVLPVHGTQCSQFMIPGVTSSWSPLLPVHPVHLRPQVWTLGGAPCWRRRGPSSWWVERGGASLKRFRSVNHRISSRSKVRGSDESYSPLPPVHYWCSTGVNGSLLVFYWWRNRKSSPQCMNNGFL